MKLSFSLRSMVLACCALAISSQPALLHAADGTWIQTTAGPFDWGTPGNWAGSTVADGVGSTAFFTSNITDAQTVNLAAPQTIGNITFTDAVTSHNLTISGANALTLDVTTGTPVIDVTQSNRQLTISSVVTGNDGLQKNGPGTLSLSGANTYTGGTFITGGSLGINSSSAPAVRDGSLSLSGGGQLRDAGYTSTQQVTIGAGGGSIYNGGNANYVTTGILTGSDTFTYLTAAGGANRSVSFNSTANDFTGRLVIEGLV